MERYICIHGHFYQPPRENAWLEYVEMQDSAYPYNNWNERVTAECYAPNTASRILDGEGYITEIVNNYARISFDFGPTLLGWMKANSAETYKAIIKVDQESRQRFSGHGSALAQAYNHMIMPLANRRDKYTQVLWGIRDFEYRFGRKPEGMWLPETAVDLETLDILAALELKFTILAPHQAKRVRQLGSDTWTEVGNSSIDPTMAYEIRLPSKRKLALFFYDGPISQNVAFEDLLTSGDRLVQRLVSGFLEERTGPQLVHIATDGETYGHHHRFGDMALAFALHYIEANGLAQVTNYGEYLEKHLPTHEVEINENTSWSCNHGIERWRSDCGCKGGRNPKWQQSWRAPLREALDWLRDILAPKYEGKAKELFKDPWNARNQYIEVVLDRSSENVRRFLEQHRTRELTEEENIIALKLLELQRHAMLMYTSCGWFFDELSSIETVQVIQYAGRAVQLAQELFGNDLDTQFLERLELAKSNIPEHGDGRRIYDKFVKPAMVDLTKVAAHFAVSSLFEEYGRQAKVYCYRIDLEDYHTYECGKARLGAGRAKVISEITLESATLSFGVLHFGGHNVNAGVREFQGEEAYQTMLQEVTQTFSGADFTGVIRLLDKHFVTSTYSLKSLFRNEQHKVMNNILESALSEIETAYYQVYEHHYPPMRFLAELGYPIPKSYQSAAEFILNAGLRRALSNDVLDLEHISSLLGEVQTWQVELDTEGLSYLLQQSLEKMIARLVATPEDVALLNVLLAAAQLTRSAPFPVELWKVQNQYYKLLHSSYMEIKKRAQEGDEAASAWLDQFILLGQQLSLRVS
jgi:alpha-amylase/alpha-mannosidase (GH57 family)